MADQREAVDAAAAATVPGSSSSDSALPAARQDMEVDNTARDSLGEPEAGKSVSDKAEEATSSTAMSADQLQQSSLSSATAKIDPAKEEATIPAAAAASEQQPPQIASTAGSDASSNTHSSANIAPRQLEGDQSSLNAADAPSSDGAATAPHGAETRTTSAANGQENPPSDKKEESTIALPAASSSSSAASADSKPQPAEAESTLKSIKTDSSSISTSSQIPSASSEKSEIVQEPLKSEILTSQQLETLKMQVTAFRYLSRNAVLPQPIQAALSNAGHGTREVDLSRPKQRPSEQDFTEKAVLAAKAHLRNKLEQSQLKDENADAAENPLMAKAKKGVLLTVDPFTMMKSSIEARRTLVPSILPAGIDPYFLAKSREDLIQARIQHRIKELENLPSNLPIKQKIASLIELKRLRMLPLQRKLREDVVRTMKRVTSLDTAADRASFRRLKRQSLREARVTEQLEKKHRLEREKKEKQKHLDYLASVLNHGKEMMAFHRASQQKVSKVTKAVLNWHATAEKEQQKIQEKVARERLKALREGDEEAYLKLIDKKKDTRITEILAKTDEYISTLARDVLVQKSANQSQGTDEDNADADQALMNGDYYSAAHTIKEAVTQQPTILVGGKLKEYQMKGLQWMVSLYNNRLNGILADEMGLGKTIQTISLVTYLMEFKNQNGPFLVIVPLSTLTNWTLEFEKWAPSVSKISYKGTPAVRKTLQAQIKRGGFNVLLTTYEYIIKDKSLLGKIKWVYMIIDEGHRMKNAHSKLVLTLTQHYDTRYRLILTGTPLQNNLPELWALLNFILPYMFKSVKTFDDWFNQPFASTSEQIALNEEEQLLIIKRLHKVLRPFLLRRLKKDVESELPDKIEKVIKCHLSPLQRRLYNQMVKHGRLFKGMEDEDHKSNKTRTLNNMVMQLRKICNHPFIYQDVENVMNPLKATDNNIWRVSGKFELLDRVLPKFKATGHKVLIFFQMTQIMTIFEDYCVFKGYSYERLDGTIKAEDRGSKIKDFNEQNKFLFLLSTRAGGLGLNLQSADTVILFDSDWNPHQDLQAQDRAHRIGQKNEVRIFRLISVDSIEETILQRAQFKLDVDGKVIQAGKFDNKSTMEEREELLRALLETTRDNGDEDGEDKKVFTDEELNEHLARGDKELELFRQMDVERYQQSEYNEDSMENKVPGRPFRLVGEDELPDIFAVDPDEEAVTEVVVGKRARKEVSYSDNLTEAQWLKKIEGEDDSDSDSGAGKRNKRKRRDSDEEQESEPSWKRTSPAISSASTPAATSMPATPAPQTPAPPAAVQTTSTSAVTPAAPSSAVAATAAAAPSSARSTSRRASSTRGGSAAAVTPTPATPAPAVAAVPAPATPAPTTPAPASTASAAPSSSGEKKSSRSAKKSKHLSQAEREELNRIFENCYEAVESSQDETGRSRSDLFLELPSKHQYPEYYKEIKKPIALDVIKRRMESDEYDNINDFREDFELMFRNATIFNQEGSEVYMDALAMREEFLNKLKEMVASGESAAPTEVVEKEPTEERAKEKKSKRKERDEDKISKSSESKKEAAAPAIPKEEVAALPAPKKVKLTLKFDRNSGAASSSAASSSSSSSAASAATPSPASKKK